MGKIDIAIYIILVLMVLFGYTKGFFKQVLSTANWLVSLILSFLFVKPFSKLMMRTPLQGTINSKIGDWISSKGGVFDIPYEPANGNEQIADAISNGLKLPKFIADAIAKGINFDVPDGTTLKDILVPSIGSIIMTIISFIILFIMLLLIIKLIVNLLNIIFDRGLLGFFNKILGAALGLVKSIIFISLAMLLLSTLASVIPSINDFVVSDLKLNESGFRIGKFFYENNILIEIIKGSFSFENIINYLRLMLIAS